MDRDKEIDELYETFERLRGERQDAKRTLDTELDRRWRNIVIWRDVRFETIFTSRYWSDAGKRLEYSKLEADAAEKFADEKRYATAQRAAFQQSWPPLTWRMFLRNAAMLGNRAALGALRRSQARHHRAVGALVSGDATPEAKRVIERELRPEVLASGEVVYRLSDGGRVVDRGAGLEIEKMSDLAALLALSAGAERSANGCVTLPADAVMAAQMIDVAASHRLNVRFTDTQHEEARREGVWRSEQQDAMMAEAVFAAERAAASSVPYRMWTADDAGAAAFEGLYSLDGAHALLLRKNDTVLVMQVTAAEAAAAGDTMPGASVEVTAEGRMVRKARAQ